VAIGADGLCCPFLRVAYSDLKTQSGKAAQMRRFSMVLQNDRRLDEVALMI
jgi:hypothetical protein